MSKQQRIYLDYNATAPVRAEAAEIVADVLNTVGNASSVHTEGRHARAVVETARSQIAQLVGGDAANVIFTSGGTEANNMAIQGVARRGALDRILISGVEHPSIPAAADLTGLPIETIPVDQAGILDLGALKSMLELPGAGRALVCVMYANNETGVIQPVKKAVDLTHIHGGVILVDAVQAAGKVPLDFSGLKCDFLAISAHKLGGVIGSGALIVRDGAEFAPLISGGGQELGRRGGTENISGIAGFGAAAYAASLDLPATRQYQLWRTELENRLLDVSSKHVFFGAGAERLPNTLCFAYPGLTAETALIALDLAGIAVSSGSACSSGKVAASPVLRAMNIPTELANGAIRVSFGFATKQTEIERFVDAWASLVEKTENKKSAANRRPENSTSQNSIKFEPV